MWPFGVVEVDPLADDAPGLEAVGKVVQIDSLVFEGAPQPLHRQFADLGVKLTKLALNSPENLRLFVIAYPSSVGGIHLKQLPDFPGPPQTWWSALPQRGG